MKFAKYLLEHSVPEWKAQYVNYKKLKKFIKAIHKAYESRPKKKHSNDEIQSPSDSQTSVIALEFSSEDEEKIDEATQIEINLKSLNSQQIEKLQKALSLSNLVPDYVLSERTEEKFFNFFQSEMFKVEKFYKKQEIFFVSQFQKLIEDLQKVGLQNVIYNKQNMQQQQRLIFLKNTIIQKNLDGIQKACLELRRGLDFLHDYKIINYNALIKALKKHDKNSGFYNQSRKTILPLIEKCYFHTSGIIETLIKELELVFAKVFTSGDKNQARELIREIIEPLSHRVTFWLGFLLGICFSLMVAITLTLYYLPNFHDDPLFFTVLPIFRFLYLIILQGFGWGTLIYFFNKYKINYAFIFDMDIKARLSMIQVYHFYAIAATLFLFMFFLYLAAWGLSKLGTASINAPGWIHFILFEGFFLILILPLNLFYFPTRRWVGNTLVRIFSAPFKSVTFKDFFLADQMCSMVPIFLDITYSACFYLSLSFLRPDETSSCKRTINISPWILAMMPYYLRFMQCCRRYYDDPKSKVHAVNAGKYLVSMIVTLCNLLYARNQTDARLNVWIVMAIIGTTYSYCWDIKMDWGFLDNIHEYKILRENTLVPHRQIYYIAAIVNLVLRISWVLTISPGTFGLNDLHSDFLLTLTSSLEIIRRTIWNFFRLENEQLSNCGKFRVTTLVPLDIRYNYLEETRNHEERVLEQIATLEPLLVSLGNQYGTGGSPNYKAKEKERKRSKSQERSPLGKSPL